MSRTYYLSTITNKKYLSNNNVQAQRTYEKWRLKKVNFCKILYFLYILVVVTYMYCLIFLCFIIYDFLNTFFLYCVIMNVYLYNKCLFVELSGGKVT